MPGVTLHELIEALANSVTAAQDQVERFQIANLSRYFDENHRPVRVEVRVPSLRPSAEPGEEDIIAVPLLAVVGSVRLAIKDVEISMEIDIGELTAPEGSAGGPEVASPPSGEPPQPERMAWGVFPRRRAVAVDVQSPRTRERPALAKVVLRVEKQEPTEGFARLLMILNQRIGPISSPPAADSTSDNSNKTD